MTDWESFVGVDAKFHIHGHVGSEKTINAECNHLKLGLNGLGGRVLSTNRVSPNPQGGVNPHLTHKAIPTNLNRCQYNYWKRIPHMNVLPF